jgi:hypothetical protein
MNKVRQFIYGSEPFEIELNVPRATAIERLKEIVHRTTLTGIGTERIVGSVNEYQVKLQRVIPMVQNSFKPILVGTVTTKNGKTILTGVFRFHRYVQIFLTIWFGFIAFWTLLSLSFVVAKPIES